MKTYEAINLEQPESETDPFTEDRYRQFHRFLPAGTNKVLDIGCNTGRGGAVLKAINPGLHIAGLDVVRERLDRLPSQAYSDRILGSCTDIPGPDDQFDAIVAGEFIEHLYGVDVDKSLYEMFRVLRLGGRVLMTTPNPGDWKRRARGRSVLGGAHLSQHHPGPFALKLKMCGFSNVRLLGSGKVSRYLGSRFPLLNVYGSYLVMGDKF